MNCKPFVPERMRRFILEMRGGMPNNKIMRNEWIGVTFDERRIYSSAYLIPGNKSVGV
jgi:hypothetical protein